MEETGNFKTLTTTLAESKIANAGGSLSEDLLVLICQKLTFFGIFELRSYFKPESYSSNESNLVAKFKIVLNRKILDQRLSMILSFR